MYNFKYARMENFTTLHNFYLEQQWQQQYESDSNIIQTHKNLVRNQT